MASDYSRCLLAETYHAVSCAKVIIALKADFSWVQEMDSYKLLASILDTEQDAPEIIWNMDMRRNLVDHLTRELEPYVKFRASDPMALYVHTSRAPIHYPQLAGKSGLTS